MAVDEAKASIRILCRTLLIINKNEPGLQWLIGSPFFPPFTIVSTFRCIHTLPSSPLSPDYSKESDDLRSLLLRGFEVIGALIVGNSADGKQTASKAVNALCKLRKFLSGNFDGRDSENQDLVGAVADSNSGRVHFFVSRSGKSTTLESVDDIIYEDQPEKYVWERGCLLLSKLQIKLPVYCPIESPNDAEDMYLRATDAAADRFRDPATTFVIETISEPSTEVARPIILHGVELDFHRYLKNASVSGEIAHEADATTVACSHFCSKSNHISSYTSIEENADKIQVSMLHNASEKSYKAAAPIVKYFPASKETKLVVVDFKLEVLCYAAKDLSLNQAVSKLIIPGLVDQLCTMKNAIFPNLLGQHPLLHPYHFSPPGFLHPITAIYDLSYGETELKQVEARRSLHLRLGLPFDCPLLRIANVILLSTPKDNARSNSARKGSPLLKNVHIGIPNSGVSGGIVSMIRGSYEYHHYLQDGYDDSGWGCAYRSLQTIISWFRHQHYTSIDVPSHSEIQRALVEIGDKGPAFIGSRDWIGAIELSFVLDKLLGLMAVPVELRILALTATPGSKHQTIQNIIDNLQISTLEYRNESDHDVRPYVHDRKVELIEVAMAEVAVEINNGLLEVIHPLFARLCALGVLQNRDMKTLSPMELLNSRDRFRQAPPLDLPQLKHGEVEGYFGVLITLYHICKLLSSHGIRPAYDMLEDKLQQGYFARLMTRNEVLQKLMLLMHQSLSHGAPDPKLSKMLEVLIDHFKTKDPQNSRVIIFSNFRGSVRDIMAALMNIGDFVKATQFIGQSSGKTLKGQSQKVQQAVLEKFRAGGYNVIVATSIGEEGLDIMEVDLVICFDANISPLRMIQRMGRTGRKHDGRVVVLAFQGTELKGYLRKQANNRSINKHMRNGGMNSFNFHASPRMIPHIFKPEGVSIELCIEQFIPRGRKGRVDGASQTPTFKAKLTDAETDLVAKYFHPTKESTWRPSLIAFPHFQASPSREHRVFHSSRAEMLIDAMKLLQGLAFVRDNSAFLVEDNALSNLHMGVDTVEQHEHSKEEVHSQRKIVDSAALPVKTDVVNGRIEGFSDQSLSKSRGPVAQQENTVDMCEKILQTPVSKVNSSNVGEEFNVDTPQENKSEALLVDDSSNGLRDAELSPRLSNFIKTGVVPESPMDYTGTSKVKGEDESVGPVSLIFSIPEKEEKIVMDSSSCGRNVVASGNDVIQTPLLNKKCESTRGSESASLIIEDAKIPSTPNSCSKDWRLDSGSKSESIKQEKKFKRLRKYGDQGEQRPLDRDIGRTVKQTTVCGRTNPTAVKNDRGKTKPVKNVRDFIEEEAEVSSEVEVSGDEEVDPDNNSYDDSFIDDRMNPTQASTQPETSGTDMMAIYRRSLLSQSPMERLLNGFAGLSPRMSDIGSSSGTGTVHRSLQTPQTGSQSAVRISNSSHLECKPISTEQIPRGNENRIGALKRKLSFYQDGSVPAVNSDQVCSSHSEAAHRETSQKLKPKGDISDDDRFYEGLDLDVVEEEAARLLGYKSDLPVNKKAVIPDRTPPPLRAINPPTFDLGI